MGVQKPGFLGNTWFQPAKLLKTRFLWWVFHKRGHGNAVSLPQNVLIVGTRHCRVQIKFGHGNAVSLPQKSYRRDTALPFPDC
jgi:hypothetical protein